MKLKEKEEAINLRKQGKSIREIVKKLKVSKGSISRWVRDIELTEEQLKKLDTNKINNRFGNRKYYYISKKNINNYKEKRKEYQENGRNLFKIYKEEPNFVAGIMLYWAEGGKGRNSINFSNSDADMISIFLKFLRKYFNINENKLTFNLQYYTNNGISEENVNEFWKNKLNLKDFQKRKDYIDYRPIKNMGRKVGKCPYGICRIVYNDVKIIQMIYGAIKEMANINNDKWLN